MMFQFDKSSRDQFFQSSEIYENNKPPDAVRIKGKLDFVIMVNNPDYDNDDNPYGKFVLHMYTNMRDENDTEHDPNQIGFDDLTIPLKVCDHPINTAWRKSNVNHYCPDFND